MNRDKRILDNEQEQKEEQNEITKVILFSRLQKLWTGFGAFSVQLSLFSCVRTEKKLWTEKSEGRVGAIMERAIGKLWKWKRKWDFKTFSHKTSLKISSSHPKLNWKPNEKWRKSKFPYLHHQLHCTVDELQRCRHANSRWTIVASAYEFLSTLTSLADVFGCLIDRADGGCAQTYHCYESSAHRDATASCATLSDGAACCHWYDCVYVVTSYTVGPRDPSKYTTRWGDIPVILPTRLQLV